MTGLQKILLVAGAGALIFAYKYGKAWHGGIIAETPQQNIEHKELIYTGKIPYPYEE